MKVLVSGSTGLLGSALVPELRRDGHSVTRLVRSRPQSDNELQWNPGSGELPLQQMEGFDAVFHFSGEPVATWWTAEKKRRIRDSRVDSTTLLAKALAQLQQPPRFLGSASAIGFYGSRGDELLDESSSSGTGFLAEVCQQWEAATAPAQAAGIRVANFRIGVVLSTSGGILGSMLPPFRRGLGVQFGNGRQWLSWITREDIVGALRHVLANESISGPVNLVAPGPVTQQTFVKTLGEVLSKPVPFTIPAAPLRLVAREMADEMLLVSQRVQPQVLLSSGYKFQHPELKAALQQLL